MPHTVTEKIRRWSREYDSNVVVQTEPPPYLKIQSQIDYLAERLYREYEITKSPLYQEFAYRLRDWLSSAPQEDDQKILFQLVPRIFFIGASEYLSLYRSAFNGPIAQWLIEQLDLRLNDRDIQTKLKEAMQSTWVCALTDSMQIARFYHSNHIEGTLRPDWRVLTELADQEKIEGFMNKRNPQLERIVLLEDFVGTGRQIEASVKFVASLRGRYAVLLCPLVICPSGYRRLLGLGKNFDNLQVSPVLLLDESVILHKHPQADEEPYAGRLREVIMRLDPIVRGSDPDEHYKPFGFGENEEGGGLMVVMHTNCPNNTIPVIHHQSDGPWNPLFPRAARV